MKEKVFWKVKEGLTNAKIVVSLNFSMLKFLSQEGCHIESLGGMLFQLLDFVDMLKGKEANAWHDRQRNSQGFN